MHSRKCATRSSSPRRSIPTAPRRGWSKRARFERGTKLDALAAQRHLAIALQLLPRDAKILSAFREVAAMASSAGRELAPAPPAPPSLPAASPDPARDEELAQTLTDRLRGDPDNHAVAVQLADVLARLERHLEALCAPLRPFGRCLGGVRTELLPRQREVLGHRSSKRAATNA